MPLHISLLIHYIRSNHNCRSDAGAQLQGIANTMSEDDDDNITAADDRSERVIQMDNRDPLTGSLHISEKMKLMQILGRWEDPDVGYQKHVSSCTLIRCWLQLNRNAHS